jgi:hypothetical protein
MARISGVDYQMIKELKSALPIFMVSAETTATKLLKQPELILTPLQRFV